jgi:hypothetical protein
MQLLLPISGGIWERVRDGDPRWRGIYDRHYSARRYRDGRRPSKLIGPGEYLLLATPTLDGIFAWRRFVSMDRQRGVACSIFRNEGPIRSSVMILEAMEHARERWPSETRGYTYVDASRIRSSNPGACFLKAGWRRCGRSQGGLYILECDLGAVGSARQAGGPTPCARSA